MKVSYTTGSFKSQNSESQFSSLFFVEHPPHCEQSTIKPSKIIQFVIAQVKKKKKQPINQPLSFPSLHNDPVCFSSGSPERVHRTSEKSLDEQHSVGSSASNPRKSSLSLLHFGQQIYWRDDTKLLIIKR